jgi:hypothetical protein
VAVILAELTVEVVVLCVYCDEPLEHAEDLWCPDCEDEEGDEDVGRPAEQRLAA